MSLGSDCRDPLWASSEWEGDKVFLLPLVSAHVGPFMLFVQVKGLGWFFGGRFCSACLEPKPVNYETKPRWLQCNVLFIFIAFWGC